MPRSATGVETNAEILEESYWPRVRKPGRTDPVRNYGYRRRLGSFRFNLHLYRLRRVDIGSDVNQPVNSEERLFWPGDPLEEGRPHTAQAISDEE